MLQYFHQCGSEGRAADFIMTFFSKRTVKYLGLGKYSLVAESNHKYRCILAVSLQEMRDYCYVSNEPSQLRTDHSTCARLALYSHHVHDAYPKYHNGMHVCSRSCFDISFGCRELPIKNTYLFMVMNVTCEPL